MSADDRSERLIPAREHAEIQRVADLLERPHFAMHAAE